MLRPVGTARRLNMIGSGSIAAGLILLAVSLWCVTTLNGPSFNLDTFAGARPSADQYILLVIEIAITLAGAYSLLLGIVTLRKSRKQITFARSMHLVDAEFVTSPKDATAGSCWQCGSNVKANNPICYVCGAAQKHNALPRRPGYSASEHGWDLAAAAPINQSPWDAPPSQQTPPAEEWKPAMYQPGAPPPWLAPPDPPPPAW